MKALWLSIALALPVFGSAQVTLDDPGPIVGARSLALSPDGKWMAYSYRGDIWVVSSEGGQSRMLTNHIEMDDVPVWSPDGKWIAFLSNRSGSNDVYIISVNGGEAKRLTFTSMNETLNDWSPDGKKILFRGYRDLEANGLYEIEIATGNYRAVTLDMTNLSQAKYSPDGKTIVFTRSGFPISRPRYSGSAAAQLWTMDSASGNRSELRNNQFQNLWPTYTSSGEVLCSTVSDLTPSATKLGDQPKKFTDTAARTPNIYMVKGARAVRLTNFVGGPGTRYLTAASRAPIFAFERDGEVYTSDLSGKSTKLTITAPTDEKTSSEEFQVLSSGAMDVALTPKGESFVFEAAGDLWSVPTAAGKGPNANDAMRLTQWAGMDTEPIMAPDGGIFYISDQSGVAQLYKLDIATQKSTQLTNTTYGVTNINMSPTKKYVLMNVLGQGGGLFRMPVGGGALEQLVSDMPQQFQYAVSPDEMFVSYSDAIPRAGYYFWSSGSYVFVKSLADGKTHKVTSLNVNNSNPTFSADGKYLYMLSDREGPGLYAIPLNPEDARTEEIEIKFEKPTAPVKVSIDFDGIEKRIRKFVGQGIASSVLSDPENGDIFFISEGDIWKAKYDGSESRRITGGGGIQKILFSEDGRSLVVLRNFEIGKLDIRNPQFPISMRPWRGERMRNLKDERAAALQQLYSTYLVAFYDGNFHGRNWKEIRDRTARLLPSVGHRNEMATILGQMTGELEASHAEVGPAGGNPRGPETAMLGFEIDQQYSGEGLKIKRVPKYSPGAFAKTKLAVGELVTKINGKAVSRNESLMRETLTGQVGRNLNFTVKASDGKERTVTYRVGNLSWYQGLTNREEIERQRAVVEKATNGQVSYVLIEGMGGGNLDTFNKEFWQAADGRKGMIIDVRGNGGGNISDMLIDMLERKSHSMYRPRDRAAILAPGQAPEMPLIVMCDETSFSNAEMFPYAMRQRKLAKLVGNQTPGYVIWTNGLPLVDGTSARLPNSGVFRLDGTSLENLGEKPDYVVINAWDDYFKRRDPQLDKAIEVIMGMIKK